MNSPAAIAINSLGSASLPNVAIRHSGAIRVDSDAVKQNIVSGKACASKGMNDATQLLTAVEKGEPMAAEQLLALLYGELRRLAASKMAREAPGQTLQPTALVHEAWL